jgi:nucleoside phosphorylase
VAIRPAGRDQDDLPGYAAIASARYRTFDNVVDTRDAIIQPMRGKHSPRLAPVAVLAATEPDLDALRRGLGLDASDHRRLYISRLYTAAGREPDVCLAGPVVGAPYATMVAETLIAWGARTILFIGWCGAVSPVLTLGDLVVPTAAVVDEGTSPHYAAGVSAACPSEPLMRQAAKACTAEGFALAGPSGRRMPFSARPATRCPPSADGVLAVEMECSALFTVGELPRRRSGRPARGFRRPVLLAWRPGSGPALACGREVACNVIGRLCSTLAAA